MSEDSIEINKRIVDNTIRQIISFGYESIDFRVYTLLYQEDEYKMTLSVPMCIITIEVISPHGFKGSIVISLHDWAICTKGGRDCADTLQIFNDKIYQSINDRIKKNKRNTSYQISTEDEEE